jgi:predicted small metal-binding protein
MKEFSCASIGVNCKTTLTAPTDEKLLELVSSHARERHGMTAIPEDMLGKIRNHFVNRAPSDAAYVVDRIFEKYNCNKEPECTWRFITEAEMILTGKPSIHEKELKAA